MNPPEYDLDYEVVEKPFNNDKEHIVELIDSILESNQHINGNLTITYNGIEINIHKRQSNVWKYTKKTLSFLSSQIYFLKYLI